MIDWVDNGLHVAAGFGLTAASVAPVTAGWLPWWTACVTVPIVWVGWGWLREQAQHRDQGWWGWWTWGRALEGATWGIGAALAMGSAALVRVLT